MKSSPAELSYLHQSLIVDPPIRPDARLANQFRPLEATTRILPTANGSARVRSSDGGECIVGVKAKVVRTAVEPELISVDVDITGIKDNHPLPNLLAQILQSTLNSNAVLKQALKLTSRFSFKLFVDAIVLSNKSHPLGMLSFAVYMALMSTKLPLLTSSTDDEKAEEVPVFHDDWDQAVKLCAQKWQPPLLFVLAVVGENVLLDPSHVEEKVSSAGLFISWANGQISGPVRTIDLGSSDVRGLSGAALTKAYSLVSESAQEVASSLNSVVAAEEGNEMESLF
jgi:exosome complex component RRP42